jgi:hypothetical protein
MLVTFSTPAHPRVTMFGDVAVRLLRIVGHSGTIPGALYAEDVQAALTRLETAVAKGEPTEAPEHTTTLDENEDGERAVSLRHRALPLIDLLRSAVGAEGSVMWSGND